MLRDARARSALCAARSAQRALRSCTGALRAPKNPKRTGAEDSLEQLEQRSYVKMAEKNSMHDMIR